MEVQIISEEHIADSMPQVVTGTVVEQIVDVPALQLQEGLAEEIVDSTVPLIKEEIVEVIQPLPQDCTQGRLAVAYQRAHRWADRGIPAATDRRNNRGGASASGAHPRAQCGADTGIHCV